MTASLIQGVVVGIGCILAPASFHWMIFNYTLDPWDNSQRIRHTDLIFLGELRPGTHSKADEQ